MSSTSPNKTQYLSHRGAENILAGDHWREITDALANPYHASSNPGGVINMGLAESSLMHEELITHFTQNFTVSSHDHLTYGQGPKGSPRLRRALAALFNSHFHPINLVHETEILVTSGVASLMDSLTWCLCNEGEGILIPRPVYTGFQVDIPMRSRGRLVPVAFAGNKGTGLGLDEVFAARANEEALTAALEESENTGVKVRAVLLTNPHNPLGKCYPVDTVKTIARFCALNNLHLLSDEIYANTVFVNPAAPESTPFTSVLAMDLDDTIDPNLVHVMYGASKDFCANGIRLGVLQSRNKDLREAVGSINVFAWPSYMVQDMWARILEDRDFLDNFMKINKMRLSKSYALATFMLDEHKIEYFHGGNAGMFIWLDLRRLFRGVDNPREKEKRIVASGLKNGVFVRDGSNFFTEEIGWFRMTFTTDESTLRTGLERFSKSLNEVEAGGC